MRAIILAAGVGRRLALMNWNKPKCLLPCPQGTLLDNVLQAVHSRGIDDVVVVCGYGHEQLRPVFARYEPAISVVMNEDYGTTNTIHSLWKARQYLDTDCLLFNGDVWFEQGVLDDLLAAPHSALAVDVKPCGEEEVKVVTDSENRILHIGKDVPTADARGEYIGIGKFDASTGRALAVSLERFNTVFQKTNLFYEAALDVLLDHEPVFAAVLKNDQAVEVDTPEDYRRAQSLWTK